MMSKKEKSTNKMQQKDYRAVNSAKNRKIIAILFLINIILSLSIITIKLIPAKDGPSIIVNPIGYVAIDQNKTFLLKTNEPIDSVNFQVINNNDNSVVLTGKTEYRGELWRKYYSEGNFSAITAEGNYSITLELNGRKLRSYPFEISNNVYLSFIDLLYKFFFYQRCGVEVPDNVVLGYVGHKKCHADDASLHENSSNWVNLTGGWHDAGDYNKYHSTTAISFLGLALAYEQGKNFYDQPELSDDYPILPDYSYQSDSISDLLEEVIWGADFMAKMILENGSVVNRVGSNDFHGWYGYSGIPSMETDGDNETDDNRIYTLFGWENFKIAAGLLKTVLLLNRTEQLRLRFADRIKLYYEKALKTINYTYKDPKTVQNFNKFEDLMLADIYLYNITGETHYKEEANYIGLQFLNGSKYDFKNPGFGHIGIDQIPAKLYYWVKFNGSSQILDLYAQKMEDHFNYFWEPLTDSKNANNFFHLLRARHLTRGEFYFWDYTSGGWNVGQNSYYAVAAWASLLTYDITKEYKYLDLALRQIDWICGKNPFSLTMIEGVGEKNLPSYHNRAAAINGNDNGAIPGTVPNGLIRVKEINPLTKSYYDEPWYDPYISTLESSGAEYMSNEMWIPHNSNFLLAITALYAIGLNHPNF